MYVEKRKKIGEESVEIRENRGDFAVKIGKKIAIMLRKEMGVFWGEFLGIFYVKKILVSVTNRKSFYYCEVSF